MPHQSYYILMADVIRSGYFDQKHLMKDFQTIVQRVNKRHTKRLLSPLTITLGDEFQGIPTTLAAALEIMTDMEEEIIRQQYTFQLRYALGEGEIDTPINKKIAHGMLGDGLTTTRRHLELLKTEHQRFHIALQNSSQSFALNQAFIIYQSLVDSWRPDKDYATVAGFLEEQDYKAVARRVGQNYSQTWKKQRTLHIDEYRAAKEVIVFIGGLE